MKKRYLRKEIEYALSIILSLMFMLTIMVDSFELSLNTLYFAVIWFSVMFVLYKILKKYGRGIIYDNEGE